MKKMWFAIPIAAILFTFSFMPVAQASSIKPQSDIFYEWQIDSVGSPYTSYGAWNFGTQGTNNGSADAQLTFSQTIGYSNTVSGTNEVSDSVLSSAVGFSVTYSSSSTAGYSMTLLPGQTGEIDWRDVYSSKDVTEQEYYRYTSGGSWTGTGDYAYCTASEWEGFGYQGTIE